MNLIAKEQSMDAFDLALHSVLKYEGGYSNDKDDAGGPTNFGITEETARSAGFIGDMQNITIDQAKSIYRANYWDKLKLDEIAIVSQPLSAELFESAVNCGVVRVANWFCTAVQIIANSGTNYPEAVEYAKNTPSDCPVLTRIMNVMQGNHYLTLVQKNEKYRKFIRGWMKRVIL
jgi:lysozyme family protein